MSTITLQTHTDVIQLLLP